MNEEKPPVTESMEFLMLPDDILLNCLARVSRLYYPTLALVSKKFRSLLASLERYKTRSLLGYTESCLYVYLLSPKDSNIFSWFTLCRRALQISDPNPNPRCFSPFAFIKNFTRKTKEKKLSENFLVSVPTLKFFSGKGVVTVGYKIYKIGGFRRDGSHSSKVLFMDCRTHTCHKAPNMRTARGSPTVCVLDERIYVVGGNEDCDSSNWIEFFDLKTQVWEYMQSPEVEIRDTCLLKTIAIEGKLHLMIWDETVVYNPKENRWDELGFMGSFDLFFYPSCVIDNVLYCCGPWKRLEWYDFEARSWRVVKGLERLPKLPKCFDNIKLVDYDGKIAVLWEKVGLMKKKIWCAEISLERLSRKEILGKIEWCHVVHTTSNSCRLIHSFAVTL